MRGTMDHLHSPALLQSGGASPAYQVAGIITARSSQLAGQSSAPNPRLTYIQLRKVFQVTRALL